MCPDVSSAVSINCAMRPSAPSFSIRFGSAMNCLVGVRIARDGLLVATTAKPRFTSARRVWLSSESLAQKIGGGDRLGQLRDRLEQFGLPRRALAQFFDHPQLQLSRAR